jgi:uncharacterized protein
MMRLAVFLETDTTSFRDNFLDGQYLKHKDSSGSCTFLKESGCSVHKDRPLVCRLYPLGRIRFDDGEEIFPELVPHPECQGKYGESDTVEKYLETQETESYFHAEKSYRAIIKKMADAVSLSMADTDLSGIDLDKSSENDPGWILDPDPVIKKYCKLKGFGVPSGADEKLALHLDALNAWVEGEWNPVGM